jgi:hypothetical protein
VRHHVVGWWVVVGPGCVLGEVNAINQMRQYQRDNVNQPNIRAAA